MHPTKDMDAEESSEEEEELDDEVRDDEPKFTKSVHNKQLLLMHISFSTPRW